jgi:hypothetical protein
MATATTCDLCGELCVFNDGASTLHLDGQRTLHLDLCATHSQQIYDLIEHMSCDVLHVETSPIDIHDLVRGDIVKYIHGGYWDYRVVDHTVVGDESEDEFVWIGIWFKYRSGDSGGCAIDLRDIKKDKIRIEKVLKPELLREFYGERACQ